MEKLDYFIPKVGERYKLVGKDSVILNGYLITKGGEIKISSVGTNSDEWYFTFISPSFGLGGQTPAKHLLNSVWELSKNEKEDRVNHPSHYTWLKEKTGIEVIDITRHMDFNLGNAIKYILRSGHKSEKGLSDKDKQKEDLKKAIWYINDYIQNL